MGVNWPKRSISNSLAFAGIFMVSTLLSACGESPETITPQGESAEPTSGIHEAKQADDDAHRQRRLSMVEQQLMARDIDDQRVLDAMRRVPRHLFVPRERQRLAYIDSALPIGHRQTISQPYIVALMTQLGRPTPTAKALDIGTGSGYQAAILAELVAQVYSIEILEPLAREAKTRLDQLGYKNIQVRHGDGYRGWPEQAPFDLILVAAAPDHVPQALVEQLKPGGQMVIPVGASYQDLLLIEKAADGTISQRNITPVIFVPMTGEAEKPRAAGPQPVEAEN